MIRRRGDRRVGLKHRVLRRTEQSSSSGKQEDEKEQEPEEVSLDCKTSSGFLGPFHRSPEKPGELLWASLDLFGSLRVAELIDSWLLRDRAGARRQSLKRF